MTSQISSNNEPVSYLLHCIGLLTVWSVSHVFPWNEYATLIDSWSSSDFGGIMSLKRLGIHKVHDTLKDLFGFKTHHPWVLMLIDKRIRVYMCSSRCSFHYTQSCGFFFVLGIDLSGVHPNNCKNDSHTHTTHPYIFVYVVFPTWGGQHSWTCSKCWFPTFYCTRFD